MHGTGAEWYVASKALVLSSRSLWCHSNHVKAHASDSEANVIQVHITALNGRLFDSPCRPGIYLPTKTKVEPDLSLVRDKFSVRYECWPSLEIDVN